MAWVYVLTEDALSEAVAEALVSESDGNLKVHVKMGRKGRDYIRQKLPELSRLAEARNGYPVIALTDLDLLDCPPTLINEWMGSTATPRRLLLRVAVRTVEAWLMADHHGLERFASIPVNQAPADPESLQRPKQTLLGLIDRYSPRELKRDLVSSSKGGLRPGLGYNVRLSSFVREIWNPEAAARNSDSLARARRRLSDLAAEES